jgi:FkbM family methyltransferase
MSLYNTAQRTLQRVKHRLRSSQDAAFFSLLRGVVHIGANTGQERRLYDSYGLQVLWVEPIPEVFAKLQENISGFEGQRAVQALVADQDGIEVDFHVASNDGASSSMLEMAQHRDVWPEVQYKRSIRMTTTTLPALVQAAGVDLTRFNGLVMDTQGSELLVLQGALPLLRHFDFIKTEVADFEAYKDCCQLNDLGPFMAGHGFDEVDRRLFKRKMRPGQAYYNVVYRRR